MSWIAGDCNGLQYQASSNIAWLHVYDKPRVEVKMLNDFHVDRVVDTDPSEVMPVQFSLPLAYKLDATPGSQNTKVTKTGFIS